MLRPDISVLAFDVKLVIFTGCSGVLIAEKVNMHFPLKTGHGASISTVILHLGLHLLAVHRLYSRIVECDLVFQEIEVFLSQMVLLDSYSRQLAEIVQCGLESELDTQGHGLTVD